MNLISDKYIFNFVFSIFMHFILSQAQLHVGSLCGRHEDCIRYCAYSLHGLQGASCCFPEKIRVSRSEWVKTGSRSCYCCPLPQTWISHFGPNDKVVDGSVGGIESCDLYLNSYEDDHHHNDERANKEEAKEISRTDRVLKDLEGVIEDTQVEVTHEFCSNKCVQVMIITKMSYEFPSVCRARKFPNINRN